MTERITEKWSLAGPVTNFGVAVRHTDNIKHEIRSTKSETNSKFQIPMSQNFCVAARSFDDRFRSKGLKFCVLSYFEFVSDFMLLISCLLAFGPSRASTFSHEHRTALGRAAAGCARA
jgi:hypothetical protein